jgi:hypothetical protein
MGISLSIPQIPDEEVALVNNGAREMYTVLVAIYANSQAPINEMWVTELCALKKTVQ